MHSIQYRQAAGTVPAAANKGWCVLAIRIHGLGGRSSLSNQRTRQARAQVLPSSRRTQRARKKKPSRETIVRCTKDDDNKRNDEE